MPPLRIGVDASGLAALKPATGLQRYLAGLVTHLAPRCADEDLRLYLYFTQPPKTPGPPLRDVPPGEAIRWRVAPMARGWQRIGMGLAMLADRIDVFHFPAPLMAGFCPAPAVVTVHDLAALSLDPKHTAKERRYLTDALIAVRRARALIAVSRSAAQEVERHVGRTDSLVIPEGVDAAHFRPVPAEDVQALCERLGVSRYVLCVGTLQTRKNHLGLIRAFAAIQDQIPHTLLLVGGEGSGAAEVRAFLAAHPEIRVQLAGYIDDAHLPALYTGADVLALPSFWEGFGLPLLEAMACGTPVLTSNISSLAEIAGDAALLVDPHNTEAIADGLIRLLSDRTLRAGLISAGRARALEYDWAETARRTVAVYRAVAGRT
jgi:glycosyltransferase involved in cell wall biosynthesis